MALNIVKLIDLIKKHNDPNDATRIISIQGTSVANFFPERMKKDDVINIESGDIVWKEYGDHKEQDPVIYRTGLNNIDQIKFIPAPGEDIILDNGKVDTGNGKDIVEDDDGTKYKLIPGPQGDKGETGARGEKGEKGDMSIITLNKENGHWMIDGVDTEVSAIGPKGDKVSVTIDPSTKHWVIDGEDTNVVAEGKDGKTPEIKIDPVTKRWIIDGIDTNIVSEGVKGEKGEKTLVTIDPNTKHWLIDGVDTNVLAEGVKGDTGAEARLSIDPETKHFIINGVDSGVRAEGVKGIDGVTPEISINEVSKNWIINGHDTEIKAEGTKGEKGEKTLVTIDPNTKHWLIDGVDTNVLAEGVKGADGVDGKSAFDIATEKGFTGSKDEWLESLKGAKGVDGHDGRSANNLEVDPILLGNFRNNDASGIEVLMIGPRFNDEELSESDITENLQVTALFRGFNLRNSNENDEWKDLNNLTIESEDGNYVVKGLPFTDGVRKGDSLELILNFEYKGVDRHYYRRLDNINDGVGSVNLDKYIRREDLPATLDTSHLIARKEVEENYAKKSELPVVPSLDPYAKKEEADGKYATKESLSSVSEEVSTEKGKLSSLTDRVTAIEESKSTLATKEEVDTTYAKKSELPVVPSLEPYATKADSDEKYVSKEELVTLGNLNDKATKADLKNYYTKEETVNKETHDALNNKVESNIIEISAVKEKVTGLESSNTTVKEKIESLTSDVNSLKAKEDSDKQTLSLEGNKLAISSGNEVDLSALKTDNSAIERSVSTLNETVTGLKNRLPESIQEDDKLSTSKEVTEKVNSLKTEVETTYAKKSELPSVEGLITEVKADEKYSGKSLETTVSSLDEKVRNLEAKEDNDRQTLSITDRTITISGSNSSVTVPEQDLSSLATKADVERDYAKKSELPSVNGLISETTADERYLPKAKEETLATKEELDVVKGKVTALESKEDSDKQTLSIDGRTISISGSDSSVTVPEQDLSGLATKSDVELTYAKKEQVEKLASKSEIEGLRKLVTGSKVDTSGFITSDDADSKYARKDVMETTYAKKSELPSVEGLIAETKADGKYLEKSKEETLATKEEVKAIKDRLPELTDGEKLAKASDIPSLTNYATKEELPSTAGLISETRADEKYIAKSTESNLVTKNELEEVKGKVNALETKEDSDKQTLSITGRTITISGSDSSVTVPEQDLSSLATKEEVKSIKDKLPELTEGEKLVKKSDLPSTVGLISEATADTKYIAKSKEESLATKEEVTQKISDAKGNIENQISQLATKADVDTTYAKKSELPSTVGLISETKADEKYLEKSKETTLATKEELSGVITRLTTVEGKADKDDQTLSITGRTITISGSNSSVEVPEQDLSLLATKADVELTYAKKEQVEKLATKGEIEALRGMVTGNKVDTSGFITTEDADNKYARKDVMETTYAKKSELPSTAGLISEATADTKYVSKAEKESLATKEEVKSIKDKLPEMNELEKLAKTSDIPSLESYAKKSELPSVAGLITEVKADEKYLSKSKEETLATKAEVKEIKDHLPILTGEEKLAKTSDIPSLTGLISEATADTKYVSKSEKESLATKEELESAKNRIGVLESKEDSDKQTLSITGRTITISGSNSSVEVPEQDLSGLATKADVDTTYAKKSELPSVNGLITETAADEKYLPKFKEGSLATKEELTQKISEATNGVESKLSNLLPKSEADKNYLHKDIESNLATKNDIGEVSARISTLENKPDNDKQLLSIVGRTITISGSDSSVTVPEQDLSGLAKKSELPSVEGLITETRADEKYIPKAEKESLATKEEVKAIKDHLPVLTGEEKLAKTSDIPSVTGLISEATADTKYLEKSKEATLATKAEVKDITDKLPELAKKSELPSVEGLITEVKADGKYAPKTDLETAKERISVLESKEDSDKQTLSINNRTITISGSNSSVTVPEQDLSSLAPKSDVESLKTRVGALENKPEAGPKYYVRTFEELKALDVVEDDVVRFKDELYIISKEESNLDTEIINAVKINKAPSGGNGRESLFAIKYYENFERNLWLKSRNSRGVLSIADGGFTGRVNKSSAKMINVPSTFSAINDAGRLGYDGAYTYCIYYDNEFYASLPYGMRRTSELDGTEIITNDTFRYGGSGSQAFSVSYDANDYQDRNLLKLEDYISICKKYNMYAFIDVSDGIGNSTIAGKLADIIAASGYSGMVGIVGDVLHAHKELLGLMKSEDYIKVIKINSSSEQQNDSTIINVLRSSKNSMLIVSDDESTPDVSQYNNTYRINDLINTVKDLEIPIVYSSLRENTQKRFNDAFERVKFNGYMSTSLLPFNNEINDNYNYYSKFTISSLVDYDTNPDTASSRYTVSNDLSSITIDASNSSNVTNNQTSFELIRFREIIDGTIIKVRLKGETSGSIPAICRLYVKDVPASAGIYNEISFSKRYRTEGEMSITISSNSLPTTYSENQIVLSLDGGSVGNSTLTFSDIVVEIFIPKDKDLKEFRNIKMLTGVNYNPYNDKAIYTNISASNAKHGNMIHYNNEDFAVVSTTSSGANDFNVLNPGRSTNGILKYGDVFAVRTYNQEDVNVWVDDLKGDMYIADGGFTGNVNRDADINPVYPKNTLLAIDKAGRLGFDAVKVNITPTRDGIWVCSDETTLRNVKDSSMKNRRIADLNYNDIKHLELEGENVIKYNAGNTFRWNYGDGIAKGLTIPSLEDVVRVCVTYGMMIFITTTETTSNMDYVIKILRSHNYTGKTALVGDDFILNNIYKIPEAISIFDNSKPVTIARKLFNERVLKTFKNFGFLVNRTNAATIRQYATTFRVRTPVFVDLNDNIDLESYTTDDRFSVNGYLTGNVPRALKTEGYTLAEFYNTKDIANWREYKNVQSATASVTMQSNGTLTFQTNGTEANKMLEFTKANYPAGTIINIKAMGRKLDNNVKGGSITCYISESSPSRKDFNETMYFKNTYFETKEISAVINENSSGDFKIFVGSSWNGSTGESFKAEFKSIEVRILLPDDTTDPSRTRSASGSIYTYIRYSNQSNGNGMNEDPNSTYLGVYVGSSSTAPTSPSEYKWTKIKGEDGRQGERGLVGPQGPAGIQGPAGPVGPKGNTGDRGPQGQTGPQGSQGIQGRQGDRGIQGPAGPAGPKGNTGDRGPMGPQGPAGTGIVNQQNNQTLKYWAGTEAQYNAISNKDPNTIYDIFK